MHVLDMKDVNVLGFQQTNFFVCTCFSPGNYVIASHFGWTCCFQDKHLFDTTSVDDGVIKVLTFVIKRNNK